MALLKHGKNTLEKEFLNNKKIKMEEVDKNETNLLKRIQGKLVSKKEEASAYDVYLLATYGVIESKEKRLDTFYEGIDSLIKAKAQAGQYCCASEVPDELIKDFLEKIIKKYQELGYTVIDLNDKLEGVKRHYIFITWDNKY